MFGHECIKFHKTKKTESCLIIMTFGCNERTNMNFEKIGVPGHKKSTDLPLH